MTAFPSVTVPAAEVFNNSSSAVVVFNPTNLLRSAELTDNPAILLIFSAVAVTSTPPILSIDVSIEPSLP